VSALRVALLSALLLAATAANAAAEVPAAQNDSLRASPSGAQDVLANDSDPEAGALAVVATSRPQRGSVKCSGLGACLYVANSRAAGTDSFTYTVRDPAGEQATATVEVTIEASTAASQVVARDDDGATAAGAPLTRDPRANDNGTDLTITASTVPQHGTATCDEDSCRYEPNAGHEGPDGFTYTVTDGAQHSATAQVHVLVARAGMDYSLNPSGALLDGGNAAWSFGLTPFPEGISGQELSALPRPAGTVALTGDQARGAITTAPGWNAEPDGGSIAIAATGKAMLGEAFTQAFPRPLPPISQGTGGDGHVPILVGSKVFAFFHHSHPTSVTCVDRATGQLCPGYPKRLDVSSTDIIGPGAVEGSRIYVHALPRDSYSQSAPIGLFCWDAATDSTCGMTFVARVQRTSNPGASAPVRAGGKLWFGGDTGRLYCVDPATGDACGSLPTGLAAANDAFYDIVTHGTRVFLARSNDKVACVDVVAGSLCTGWPQSFDGAWNVVNRHNASGAVTGVCVFASTSGNCVPDASPGQRTPLSGWPIRDNYYSVTLEAETGTRTLIGSLSNSGLGCYDWSTMAVCTGGGYDQAGWVTLDRDGQSLPDAYGAAFDGACAIALGDRGRVFTVDPAGTSPCLSLSSGTDRTTVDLRDQRADGGVGSAAWRQIALSDTKPGEMESVRVTVRDVDTDEALASGDLATGNGKLDLSGIDARRHPAIGVDATARSTAGTDIGGDDVRAAAAAGPWDDAIPPRLTITWDSDAQPVGVVGAGSSECSAAQETPLGFEAALTSPTAQTASAGLMLARTPCPVPQAATVTPASTPRTFARRPKCQSRRQFVIHLFSIPGKRVTRVKATIDRKKQAILRVRPRPTIRVNLRGLGKRTVALKINVKTKSGRTLKRQRVYHTCVNKPPKKKKSKKQR
jgi:hypothetical protein